MKFLSSILKYKIFLLVLALAVIIMLVVLILFESPKEEKKIVAEAKSIESKVDSNSSKVITKPALKAIPITTTVVTKQNLPIYEKTIGTLYNLNSVELSAEVGGLVEDVFVDVGDRVKSGQILATINKKEALNSQTSKKATVASIQSQINEQAKTVSRYKALLKDGFISQAEMDAAQLQYDTLRDQLASEKSNLENLNLQVAKSEIRAKSAGIVQDRSVSEGNYVSVGTKLFSVVDNSKLIVIASYPESLLNTFKAGQSVNLSVAGVSVEIKARVKEVKPLIDEQSRSVQVIIDIPNNNFNLRPGGTASVAVLIDNRENAIVVPEIAVVLRAKGKVVYKLQSNNTVKEIPVKTGVNLDKTIEIISGLQGNERVVVNGAGFLSDGAAVQISNN